MITITFLIGSFTNVSLEKLDYAAVFLIIDRN